jgi:hypothetical protein
MAHTRAEALKVPAMRMIGGVNGQRWKKLSEKSAKIGV